MAHTSQTATNPLRILAFPGLIQNATILRAKLEPIRRAVGNCEFVVVEPLLIINMPTVSSSDDEYSVAPGHEARAWWIPDAQRENMTHFPRLDQLVAYFRDILETRGPFDAILGFSQGGAAAALLLALVNRPELHPEFSRAGGPTWPPKPFKLAILASGFLPQDTRVTSWFDQQLDTPSLHILGRGDTVVSAQGSGNLASAFRRPQIQWHTGGHYIPSSPSWCTFYKAYVETQVATRAQVADALYVPPLSTPTSTEANERTTATSGVRRTSPSRFLYTRRRSSSPRIIVLRKPLAA